MTSNVPAILEDDEPPESYASARQDARMAQVPAIYKTKHEMLACELALGMEEPEVVFQRYGFDLDAASALMDSTAFIVTLSRVSKEVAENGLSFRTKARAIAEDLLPQAYEMATDPLTSSAVRADLIKWATKVAGLEPKETKDGGAAGGGLNLSITFAGQPPMTVVQNEPLTLEAE